MHSHTDLYVEFKNSKMNLEAESKDKDGVEISCSEERKKSVIWEYYTETGMGTATCNREQFSSVMSYSSAWQLIEISVVSLRMSIH